MLDKAIEHGKEFRKPYRGYRARSCKNNGRCNYCVDNRTHATQREQFRIQQELDDWTQGKLEDCESEKEI